MGKDLGLRITETLQKRGMTQKELADSMGISQSYISRLEKKIINQLKRDIIKQAGIY